jgi:hypothetical protein
MAKIHHQKKGSTLMVICYTMLFKNFQNNYGSGGGLFLQNFG